MSEFHNATELTATTAAADLYPHHDSPQSIFPLKRNQQPFGLNRLDSETSSSSGGSGGSAGFQDILSPSSSGSDVVLTDLGSDHMEDNLDFLFADMPPLPPPSQHQQESPRRHRQLQDSLSMPAVYMSNRQLLCSTASRMAKVHVTDSKRNYRQDRQQHRLFRRNLPIDVAVRSGKGRFVIFDPLCLQLLLVVSRVWSLRQLKLCSARSTDCWSQPTGWAPRPVCSDCTLPGLLTKCWRPDGACWLFMKANRNELKL
ncbi:hypothetical protein BOX15_Mlig030651g1 [Macrostomum lignano]|uniref:Uncharacterized protein n=1 Tax=Macrostomum lignano TaxID=282301 RepID=A0A267ETR5_9PLAT|nr:hypothetical protein BOX15_Mlig030651g1 [Macrostomum lignano]